MNNKMIHKSLIIAHTRPFSSSSSIQEKNELYKEAHELFVSR